MDEMERAHRNDYEYEKKLREARTALRKVLDQDRLGPKRTADFLIAVDGLSAEMDHIVARWN
jgi:hypothetical protein